MSISKQCVGVCCIALAALMGFAVLSQSWGATPKKGAQAEQRESNTVAPKLSDKDTRGTHAPSPLTEVPDRPLMEIPIGTQGRPFVVPLTVPPHGEVRFLVDTGASITVFDESLKPDGIRSIDRRRFATSGGLLEMDVYPCPSAQLGQLDLQILPGTAYADLAAMRAATGVEIRGVLGMDFLEHFAVEIDFDLGRLQLWNTAPDEWAGAEPLLLKRQQGVCYVECTLPGDHSEPFLVDTGANVSTVREELFDTLQTKGQLTPFGTSFASTAVGSIQQTKAILSRLRLGQFQHSNLRIDRDVTNTIGLAYLSRFRLRLDLAHDLLYLQPSARLDLPDRTATCGMAIMHFEGRKVVVHIEPFGPAEAVRLLPGDVIESINGEPAGQMDMFDVGVLLTSRADVPLQLAVTREERQWEVTLLPVSVIVPPQ